MRGLELQGRGDVEKRRETYKSTAKVDLSTGNTTIFSDISKDGEQHVHYDLEDYIPKTLPYDLALRINKEGNMPQVQFNDDNVWHDFFAPEGSAGLNSGPWFPYVQLVPLRPGDSVQFTNSTANAPELCLNSNH